MLLDCWEGEPAFDPEMLSMVEIATPHIAGHSLDGKAAGTQMIYEAACRFLGAEATEDARRYLPQPDVPHLTVTGQGIPRDIVLRTCRQVYDIMDDDGAMRGIAGLGAEERGKAFSAQRRNYGPRREFYNTTLSFQGCPERARLALLGLGFREA